jgi:stachyose synthetase
MAPPNEPKPTPKLTTTGTAATTKAGPSSNVSPCLFSMRDGELTVGGDNGKTAAALLTGVPGNVMLTPLAEAFDPISKASSDAPRELASQAASNARGGAFLGFTLPAAASRAPCRVGRLPGPRRFLSVFRFKTCWSTAWAGRRGRDLQMETQWVLLEVPELAGAGAGYVFVLPLVQGSFRSAIFPGEDDGVVIWAESGSAAVTATDFGRIAYVHAGDDPYRVMQEAYLAARVHLGTFRLLLAFTIGRLRLTLDLERAPHRTSAPQVNPGEGVAADGRPLRVVHVRRLLPHRRPGWGLAGCVGVRRRRRAATVPRHRRRMAEREPRRGPAARGRAGARARGRTDDRAPLPL